LWDDATQPINKKTTMHKKNLTNQSKNSVNRLTIQDVSAEMIELSEKALSQVWGGIKPADPYMRSPSGKSDIDTQEVSPIKKWLNEIFF
jgi:hypothetical protein